jgi:predicted XRE-type DNA-binding protein
MSIEHVTPPGGNIFADLGFDPEEAANLQLRAKLMYAMIRLIRERGLKQEEAAALFGVSQPRISDMVRGKMDSFTVDSLVNMLSRAGISVEVTLSDAA